jgi:putrescine transport system permease protein
MNKFRFSRSVLVIGLFFLYIPILSLVVFSFNQGRMVNVWGGWSTKWYGVLFQDHMVLDAAWLTIRLALSAASVALILGLMIAFSLKRYGNFKGKTFLQALTFSPIIMPDVASGLALLLMFVSLQLWIGIGNLGFITMLIAHVSFCTAYSTIVLQGRLNSIDQSTEEAAMDLGAKPFKTFLLITLPQMLPSLISAWLLSITLSVDDLVITSFIRGPSETTLPIYIFSTIKTWVTPEINALATIILLIISTSVVLGILLTNKIQKH